MNLRSMVYTVLLVALATHIPTPTLAEPDNPDKYLNAVREFADNVLKYGRDTYGPKHTPLFVDGLNVNTHEPVKWIAPSGDRWILSNLASQQNLFRTLDGLSTITGDPKYRQAATEAIAYAFANLRSPNGLFYWGEVNAYDAGGDTEVFRPNYRDRCSFKAIYPHYQLMWEVDPNATEEFIETLWAAHILDWANLDMDRIAPLNKLRVTKGWEHEYKGGPVYFKSKGVSFCTTGGDLCYAACMLSKLSGKNEPLIWGKRIAHRYVETRDPRTGFSDYAYTGERNAFPFAEDFDGHTIRPVMVDFGGGDPSNRRLFLPIYILSPGLIGNYACLQTVWYFLASELLGDEGNEFKQWALEELTARGKVAYRREDNAWVPMLADGTKLEGYVCEKDMLGFARKGSVIKAWQADLTDFWAYALGYRVTSDMFLWEMARNIVRGNSLGDIGAHPEGEALLDISTDCHNAHALLGFLSLYERTQQKAFLDMAKRIGDNILAHKFYKGFFLADNKHVYARFEVVESLSLLHLFVAVYPDYPEPPLVWPSDPRFSANYRYKTPVYDVSLIYTLTGSTEPPVSLGEAAAIGDVNLVKSLIAEGVDINDVETDDFVTPLHRAVENGNEEVVRLLLSEGANVHTIAAFEGRELTPFHIAVEKGYKGIIELLISNGADVNAKSNQGRTPLDIAMSNARMDIASVLIDNGAEASFLTKMRVNMARQKRSPVDISLFTAVQNGEQQKVKALLAQGADINSKDDQGMTPLHLAAQEGHKEVVEFLLSKDADINAQNIKGYTPLYSAIWKNDPNMVELLVSKGADVNFSSVDNFPPLLYAIWEENLDIVKVLVDNGVDCDVKDQDGWTAFRYAADEANREIIELFVANGADVSSIHRAACVGDLSRIQSLLEQGTAADEKDEAGWTPLYWACSMGQEAVGKLLLSKGAQADAKTKGENTPLQAACYSGAYRLAELLVSKGADVNAKDKFGRTPLHSAATAGSREIVELLIGKGADVNARNRANWTPLHRAAIGGHKDAANLLISHGADMTVKDSRGRTPLQWATQRGHSDIADLMRTRVQVHDVAVAKVAAAPNRVREQGTEEELTEEPESGHDVAIANVSLPSTCVQGDATPIAVNVENRGDNGLSFQITLVDVTDDKKIANEAETFPRRYYRATDADLTFTGENQGDYFSVAVVSQGDLNGDGFDDLLLTAPRYGSGGKKYGRAYLYYGKRDLSTLSVDLILDSENTKAQFGQDGFFRDVNGDGIDDMVIGDWGYKNSQGRVYLYYGKKGGITPHPDKIFEAESGLTDSEFGFRNVLGDVDNDGYADLAVYADNYGGNASGRVYLYYGAPGTSMDTTCDLVFDGAGGELDNFGRSIIIGEDINGDGYGDLVIGSSGWGEEQGRAYVFLGETREKMDTICDLVLTGENEGDRFTRYSDVGDINGDGVADMAIGASYWGGGKGRVHEWHCRLQRYCWSGFIFFRVRLGVARAGVS